MSIKNKNNKKVNTIEGLARLMQGEFLGVNNKLGKVERRLGGVEHRLDAAGHRLTNVENDVREIKTNSSELFAKLDEFISLYRESKQELIFLTRQLKRLENRVARLESGK